MTEIVTITILIDHSPADYTRRSVIMQTVLIHQGFEIAVTDEIGGVRWWAATRAGYGPSGWTVRTNAAGSSRQAVTAAKASIDSWAE